jgi:hypothetical protein
MSERQQSVHHEASCALTVWAVRPYLGNGSVALRAVRSPPIRKNPLNDADAAQAVRLLAQRVRRLVPLAGKPDAFHEDKSDIAQELLEIADRISPPAKPALRGKVEARGRMLGTGRPVGTSVIVVSGRRVTVQRRRAAFAVCVEK